MATWSEIRIGMTPENRRQLFVKSCWAALWLIYLTYPVLDLVHGKHDTAATVAGWLLLAAFLAVYFDLLFRRQMAGTTVDWNLREGVKLGALLTISASTTLLLGEAWTTLFTYVSVCAGAVLPARYAMRGVAGVTAVMLLCGALVHASGDTLTTVGFACFLAGAAMTGLQRLVRTMRELREARQAIAALAASDERLRLARDLHDLLGHSLSLITLKTELTSRFMDQERYTEARAQVDDIEKVSRQALIDVREAIGGYRRPKLAVEIAAARTALTAADIRFDAALDLADPRPGLGPDEEGALGWALREAVTNVVRHSGASRCEVLLEEHFVEQGAELDGARELWLVVRDDGTGGRHFRAGNGISGLGERLQLADGRLETGPATGGRGFQLTAVVPLRAQSAPGVSGLAGTLHE